MQYLKILNIVNMLIFCYICDYFYLHFNVFWIYVFMSQIYLYTVIMNTCLQILQNPGNTMRLTFLCENKGPSTSLSIYSFVHEVEKYTSSWPVSIVRMFPKKYLWMYCEILMKVCLNLQSYFKEVVSSFPPSLKRKNSITIKGQFSFEIIYDLWQLQHFDIIMENIFCSTKQISKLYKSY